MNNDDTLAIDKIATLLGTSDDWKGADYLEMIAGIVGSVRPHPGNLDGNAYAEVFRQVTGREVNAKYDERP